MKKINKKYVIFAAILSSAIVLPPILCQSNIDKNISINSINNSNFTSRTNNSIQYHPFDTTTVDYSMNLIRDINEQGNNTLKLNFSWNFRDFVPDSGYANVFLQFTKLNFIFDSFVAKYRSYIYQLPNTINFNYNFAYSEFDNSLSWMGNTSNTNDNNDSNKNQYECFNSFCRPDTKVSGLNEDCDFPMEVNKDISYRFDLNPVVYSPTQEEPNIKGNNSSNSESSANSDIYININDSGKLKPKTENLLTYPDILILKNSKINNSQADNNVDIGSNDNNYSWLKISRPDEFVINFQLYLVTTPNYKIFVNTNIEQQTSINFKLQIKSNYLKDSSSNVVHNQYIAGGARTQIIDNLNAKNMNLILPKYIRDRKLYPSETNNGENLWEKIDINTRYIKFLNNTPIIDLNNLYVNSVNKLFNIDILVSEGYFGFYYFYKNLPLITNLNYQPIKVNIRNINPAQNKIIKVNHEIPLNSYLKLNVKFNLIQGDYSDNFTSVNNNPNKLKYYIGDIDNIVDNTNNGKIELELTTLNKTVDEDKISTNHKDEQYDYYLPNYGLMIADNYELKSVFNLDFKIYETEQYLQSIINHDIVIKTVNNKQRYSDNDSDISYLNSYSNMDDVFEDNYIPNSISNRQLIINEINHRIEMMFNNPDLNLKNWVNCGSDSFWDYFFKPTYTFEYKKLNANPNNNTNPNYNRDEGIVHVKLVPIHNNYIFPEFSFDVRVYTNNNDGDMVLTPSIISREVNNLFSNFYTRTQLETKMQDANYRKQSLLPLIKMNNGEISANVFAKFIKDIHLDNNATINDHVWYLIIDLNSDNSYYFYDNNLQKYTKSIKIPIGTPKFKDPDYKIKIKLSINKDKLANSLKECTDIVEFNHKYDTLEEKLVFFNIDKNQDWITNIDFSEYYDNGGRHLRIVLKTKDSFNSNDNTYTAVEFIFGENNWNKVNGDNIYYTSFNNYSYKNENVITPINVDIDYNESKLWNYIHSFNDYNEFLDNTKNNPDVLKSYLIINNQG